MLNLKLMLEQLDIIILSGTFLYMFVLHFTIMSGDIVMIDNFSYKLRGAEYKTGEYINLLIEFQNHLFPPPLNDLNALLEFLR